MGVSEILFLSVGLGMDAFAVAICKGLSMVKMKWKNAIIIAICFGVFQALMPLIGYLLGNKLSNTFGITPTAWNLALRHVQEF